MRKHFSKSLRFLVSESDMWHNFILPLNVCLHLFSGHFLFNKIFSWARYLVTFILAFFGSISQFIMPFTSHQILSFFLWRVQTSFRTLIWPKSRYKPTTWLAIYVIFILDSLTCLITTWYSIKMCQICSLDFGIFYLLKRGKYKQ